VTASAGGRVYLIGTVWFALASAACGLAADRRLPDFGRVLAVDIFINIPIAAAVVALSARPPRVTGPERNGQDRLRRRAGGGGGVPRRPSHSRSSSPPRSAGRRPRCWRWQRQGRWAGRLLGPRPHSGLADASARSLPGRQFAAINAVTFIVYAALTGDVLAGGSAPGRVGLFAARLRPGAASADPHHAGAVRPLRQSRDPDLAPPGPRLTSAWHWQQSSVGPLSPVRAWRTQRVVQRTDQATVHRPTRRPVPLRLNDRYARPQPQRLHMPKAAQIGGYLRAACWPRRHGP
jgi:hypothetical protein